MGAKGSYIQVKTIIAIVFEVQYFTHYKLLLLLLLLLLPPYYNCS